MWALGCAFNPDSRHHLPVKGSFAPGNNACCCWRLLCFAVSTLAHAISSVTKQLHWPILGSIDMGLWGHVRGLSRNQCNVPFQDASIFRSHPGIQIFVSAFFVTSFLKIKTTSCFWPLTFHDAHLVCTSATFCF